MSLSWTPFLNEFFSCLLLALLFSCHSLAHVSSLLLGNALFTRCGSALLSFITSFWISSFFALSSTILFHRCHFLRHHPIWPCLPKLLASVGAAFAPRRRCASARSSTWLVFQHHTLQSSSALGRHSFPSNYNTACLTRGDCFVFLCSFSSTLW